MKKLAYVVVNLITYHIHCSVLALFTGAVLNKLGVGYYSTCSIIVFILLQLLI